MDETLAIGLALTCAMVFFVFGAMIGFQLGKRFGQRLEVNEMIGLMEALKIDSGEQVVFRDRFVKALRWVRDHGTPGSRILGRD